MKALRQQQDLTGQRFGKWLVVGPRIPSTAAVHDVKWICRCDCGTEMPVFQSGLLAGRSTSCGCLRRIEIKVGDVLGRLTIIAGPHRKFSSGRVREFYWVQCVCGTVKEVCKDGLPRTISCGCYSTERATIHGMWDTSTYKSWQSMKDRGRNPNHPSADRYVERGIAVCAQWNENFENFLADMGLRPEGTSIERVDNDGGYWCGHCEECLANDRPANCKWGTRKEQMNNTSVNRLITIEGITRNVSQWAIHSGIKRSTLFSRLLLGWTEEETILIPFGTRRKTWLKQQQALQN